MGTGVGGTGVTVGVKVRHQLYSSGQVDTEVNVTVDAFALA